MRDRLASARPRAYQILAAINAVHTDASDLRDTDWSQIVALYDQLIRLDTSPIVRLNRAIAVAELDGPEVALAEIDRLPLAEYHAFHATRAHLLRRLGRDEASGRRTTGRSAWPATPRRLPSDPSPRRVGRDVTGQTPDGRGRGAAGPGTPGRGRCAEGIVDGRSEPLDLVAVGPACARVPRVGSWRTRPGRPRCPSGPADSPLRLEGRGHQHGARTTGFSTHLKEFVHVTRPCPQLRRFAGRVQHR